MDWPSYNGSNARNHFSKASQITLENVVDLKLAWTYSAGGAGSVGNSTKMQCNPIIIEGVLFGVSTDHQAFALEAATGNEIWKTDLQDETFNMTSRGVSYWSNGEKLHIFFGFGAFDFYGGNRKGDNLLALRPFVLSAIN